MQPSYATILRGRDATIWHSSADGHTDVGTGQVGPIRRWGSPSHQTAPVIGAHSSRGLGYHPFKVETRVRVPYALPLPVSEPFILCTPNSTCCSPRPERFLSSPCACIRYGGQDSRRDAWFPEMAWTGSVDDQVDNRVTPEPGPTQQSVLYMAPRCPWIPTFARMTGGSVSETLKNVQIPSYVDITRGLL